MKAAQRFWGEAVASDQGDTPRRDQTPASPEEAALLSLSKDARPSRRMRSPGIVRTDPLRSAPCAPWLRGKRLPQCRRIDGGPFCCNDHPGVVWGRKQVWASPTRSCAAQVFAVGTAAREGTISLLCTPETTSFRTRRTCARRDRARDFDGRRCVNTVQ